MPARRREPLARDLPAELQVAAPNGSIIPRFRWIARYTGLDAIALAMPSVYLAPTAVRPPPTADFLRVLPVSSYTYARISATAA